VPYAKSLEQHEIGFRKPVQIKTLRTIDSVLPVTQEIAGSNPVAPAKFTKDFHTIAASSVSASAA